MNYEICTAEISRNKRAGKQVENKWKMRRDAKKLHEGVQSEGRKAISCMCKKAKNIQNLHKIGGNRGICCKMADYGDNFWKEVQEIK